MKTKLFILGAVCWALLLDGCLSQPEIISTQTREPTKMTNTLPPAVITNTPVSTPHGKCWEPDWQMVWTNKYELRSMGEGPQGVFWFLTTATLDRRVSANGDSHQSFELKEMLRCDNCQEIANGTLVISENDEAWVGLSTGLLIVDKNGAWRQIATEEILPSANKSLGLRVLLSDDNGNIWVSNENNLCSFDGSAWQCHQIDGLRETYVLSGVQYDKIAEILSAVSGQDSQVWFGTMYGRIILFIGNEFEVYNLNDLTNTPVFSSDIGSLTFDRRTDTLWAFNTRGGYRENSIGVFQRTSNGNWQTFKKDLFFFRERTKSFYTPLTTIALTQDGTVWVGMEFGLVLVYYDGQGWKTFDGKRLPLDLNAKHAWSFFKIIDCGMPDDYVVDMLATKDGNLLIGNQLFGFMYHRP